MIKGTLITLGITLMVLANGCGGGSVGPQVVPASLPTLSATPASIAFGSVTEGTTSSAQQFTLTATNGSITISSVSISDPFLLSGITTPVTLAQNQSVTGTVTFKPMTMGSTTKQMSIASNASNSPSQISLSGNGTSSSGGGGSACTGIALAQAQIDVTSVLSGVASGVAVTQATNLPGGGAGSWNTYADLPAYSAPANVMVYNYGTLPNAVASANVDGTNAQVISGSAQATQAQVTIDGKFAFYMGQNPNSSADIYAVPLTPSGACQQIRLSNLNMTFISPAQALIISNSSIDATGHNVIAFSEGNVLHRVRDDGSTLPDITLPDSENANVLHRMRLNPVFSNIMWYKRDAPLPNPNGGALQEIWIIDLATPGLVHSLSGSTGPASPAIDHASWSTDGTKLGYISNGKWYVANVLNPDGTFNLNAGNNFTSTPVGPPDATGLNVDFCTLAPDSSLYVCAQSYRTIYLMSLDGTKTLVLANPNSSPTGAIYNGIPKPRFLDLQHIIFSSDRTGLPQIYVVSGMPTNIP